MSRVGHPLQLCKIQAVLILMNFECQMSSLGHFFQAMALQKQLDLEAAEGGVPVPGMGGAPFVMTAPANVLGRLTCTVAEAKLTRNYGIARMDPYCRIRIGHCVYETPTCPNGAREPKWNKTFNCFLLQGVTHIDVEVRITSEVHRMKEIPLA